MKVRGRQGLFIRKRAYGLRRRPPRPVRAIRASPASRVAGKGVFSTTSIPRGAIVGDFTHEYEFLTEDEYQDAQRAGDRFVIQRGSRAFGPLFGYRPRAAQETEVILQNDDYTNHSENPTLLYHCGILFARRDIAAGEELTVNYKYILAEGDVTSFVDADTGNLVSGLDGAEALRQSTHESCSPSCLSLPRNRRRRHGGPWRGAGREGLYWLHHRGKCARA